MLYHSALKANQKYGADLWEQAEPLDYTAIGHCVAMQNDFVDNGIPLEMRACDVIFAETPFPAGFKIFDERAGVTESRSFSLFADATAEWLSDETRPSYLILGKMLLKSLPTPAGVVESSLNHGRVLIAWWNDDFKGDTSSNLTFIEELARRYDCIGDFCCGYGEPLFHFLRHGGKTFVGSDHNGKCIRAVDYRLKEYFGENLS